MIKIVTITTIIIILKNEKKKLKTIHLEFEPKGTLKTRLKIPKKIFHFGNGQNVHNTSCSERTSFIAKFVQNQI